MYKAMYNAMCSTTPTTMIVYKDAVFYFDDNFDGKFDDITHDSNDNFSSNREFDANLNYDFESDAARNSASGANFIDNFEFDTTRNSSSADNNNACNNNLSVNNKTYNASTCTT